MLELCIETEFMSTNPTNETKLESATEYSWFVSCFLLVCQFELNALQQLCVSNFFR